MDAFNMASLGLSTFSILSGASKEAEMARNERASNNATIGFLNESRVQAAGAYQGMLDVAGDTYSKSLKDSGLKSGMMWDNIDRTMSEAADVSKFSNYAQFGSSLDIMTRNNQKEFRNKRDSFQIQKDLAEGKAEEFKLTTFSTIDNQKKLLKLKNQQLSKRDTLLSALL
jgi:hypothetical protein